MQENFLKKHKLIKIMKTGENHFPMLQRIRFKFKKKQNIIKNVTKIK